MTKTLITPITEQPIISRAAHKLTTDKIILIVNNPISKTNQQQIDKIKEKHEGILKITILPTSYQSLRYATQDIVSQIDSENQINNEVYLHTIPANTPQTFGIIYAASVRPNKIKGLYSIIEETGEIIQLPIIPSNIKGTKKKIIEEIKNENKSAKKIAEKLNINQSMVYAHIKDLIKKGYLNKNWDLTDNGFISTL